MRKFIKFWEKLTNRKRGLIFVGAGMACLAVCLLLLIKTESVFSTVFLYFSLALNIVGAYILMWKKDTGKDGKDGDK